MYLLYQRSHARGCAVLQFCVGSDGRPVAAAFKVMDCTEDDACSFERVYNEVRRTHTSTSTSTPLSSVRLASTLSADLAPACPAIR
jgi:hypothetical protein